MTNEETIHLVTKRLNALRDNVSDVPIPDIELELLELINILEEQATTFEDHPWTP